MRILNAHKKLQYTIHSTYNHTSFYFLLRCAARNTNLAIIVYRIICNLIIININYYRMICYLQFVLLFIILLLLFVVFRPPPARSGLQLDLWQTWSPESVWHCCKKNSHTTFNRTWSINLVDLLWAGLSEGSSTQRRYDPECWAGITCHPSPVWCSQFCPVDCLFSIQTNKR